MTWFFGFHLKWRTAKKFATRRGIKVPAWEFLSFKVHRQIQADSGVDFWINYDWRHRIIITFFENRTERDPTGIQFSIDEIARVMKVMRVSHAPRWYTDNPADAGYESDSSEDDEIGLRNLPDFERPVWLQGPPSPSESDSDSDSHWDEDFSNSETETEGIGKVDTSSKVHKDTGGELIENVREGVRVMKI